MPLDAIGCHVGCHLDHVGVRVRYCVCACVHACVYLCMRVRVRACACACVLECDGDKRTQGHTPAAIFLGFERLCEFDSSKACCPASATEGRHDLHRWHDVERQQQQHLVHKASLCTSPTCTSGLGSFSSLHRASATSVSSSDDLQARTTQPSQSKPGPAPGSMSLHATGQ